MIILIIFENIFIELKKFIIESSDPKLSSLNMRMDVVFIRSKISILYWIYLFFPKPI